MLAVACSPTLESEARAGEWLVDLGSVYCGASPLVSFSADRDWMLFWIQHLRLDTDSGSRFPVLSPAFLEVDTRRLVLLAEPVDLRQGTSFAPSSLCWDDAGQNVFLRSSALRGGGERFWYRARIGPDSELLPVAAPPDSCRRPPEVEWQWHRDVVIPAEVRAGLEVVRDGCCAVELRLADGRLLARHEARSPLSDQVMVGRYAWSDSGTRLAYTLHEETSWRFARPTRGFVLEAAGRPDPLDGRIYAFAWRGDDELIACAARSHSQGGGNSLKSWRFEAADP